MDRLHQVVQRRWRKAQAPLKSSKFIGEVFYRHEFIDPGILDWAPLHTQVGVERMASSPSIQDVTHELMKAQPDLIPSLMDCFQAAMSGHDEMFPTLKFRITCKKLLTTRRAGSRMALTINLSLATSASMHNWL
jgi:hypothetical protein